MKKEDFIEKILSGRKQLDKMLAEFVPEQMETVRLGNGWTIKDLMAHIGWYENEMVNVIRSHSLKGSEWWDLSLDDRNARISSASQKEAIEKTVEEETRAYKTMLELVEGLDESDLNVAAAFKNMPSDWQPWSVIASNTYEHYAEHIDTLREILEPTTGK